MSIGLSSDPWLAWAATCDHFRSRVVGLKEMAGCFVFPSIEAATLELSLLLADREREIGGSRNQIVYGHMQDPALDRMAKLLSATGLDAQPKTFDEFQNISTWFAEFKTKALLFALAEDDRFTGRIYDVNPARQALFADGVRVPVLTLNFGSADWRTSLPRPFEIRVYELPMANGFVTLAIVGERLRFEPRMAPLSMDAARLKEIEVSLLGLDLPVVPEAPDMHATHVSALRTEIEAFEASLPEPFHGWWPAGANRRLDRAIITSSEQDGSKVVDQLKTKLSAAGIRADMIANGLFSLSGCVMNDERRQEWLRSRGDDAWLIRGAVHISLDLIRAVPRAQWSAALA